MWAVTGAAAADLIAPHLTSVSTVDMYASEDELREVMRVLKEQSDFAEVPQGGRVRLFTERPQLFELATEREGVGVMSPVRVYANLLREGGRATEAAEYLRGGRPLLDSEVRTRAARARAEAALVPFALLAGEHAHDCVVIGGLNPDFLATHAPVPRQGTTDIDLLFALGFDDAEARDFSWVDSALQAGGFESRN